MRDIMRKDIAVLYPDSTLRQAVRMFRTSKLEGIPVTDEQGHLLGFFTRSNLYDALLGDVDLEAPVGRYMIRHPVAVEEDLDFNEVAELVKSSPVGAAPVVDGRGRVVGVFTKANMVMTAIRHLELLNARLQAVLDTMPSGVLAFDEEQRIVLVNRRAAEMTGRTVEEMVGRQLKDIFPGLQVLGGPDVHPGGGAGGSTSGGQKVALPGAVGRAGVANIVPVVDGSRQTGAIVVLQDLTELERLVRELELVKDLNQTLHTVLNIISDGLVVVDEKGVITLVNRALAEFFNCPPAGLTGRHITEIWPGTTLHQVARSGVPELSSIQIINGQRLIVSHLPIIREGRSEGAVGRIVFPQLAEIQELARQVTSLQSKVAYYREELAKSRGGGVEQLVGVSAAMQQLREEILRVAPGNSTVLITGESGTGKELVARALHYHSRRRSGPFVKVNCAAIPENLLEAELFGYEPGAFTGADRRGKPGRFELADGGTIFLDEIGELSPALQAKLLRVLQEREFERIGGTRTRRVDVRIVAATNRNLWQAVAEGVFRADLFYRLNVINLHLPPLRERSEDIPVLVSYLLERLNRMLQTSINGVEPQVMVVLRHYQWPGNVRELENVLERAANFAVDGLIRINHLPPYLLDERAVGTVLPAGQRTGRQPATDPQAPSVHLPWSSSVQTASLPAAVPTRQLPATALPNLPSELSGREVPPYAKEEEGAIDLSARLREAERQAIIEALRVTGGNKSRAARLLNMSRSRLYVRLKELGLSGN